ncbi:hypothetical protein Tsp_13623 [Trichinella spiralis]|uniref:hypothetical protein n=1 Tax=Trichinella spiralis TaxID=6334 RepID=UPI0001EFD26D|nr:hypothetical protein Tsp_13623 [Trichinella spiralis]
MRNVICCKFDYFGRISVACKNLEWLFAVSVPTVRHFTIAFICAHNLFGLLPK